jgi:TrmH family RNA methyltransferase
MTERPAGRAPLAVTLSNPRAERIKKVAALAGRSARSRAGEFLVEGPQGVRELVRFAPQRVRDLYVTLEAADRYPELIASSLDEQFYVHVATDETFAAMSTDAQGILAVVRSERPALHDVMSASSPSGHRMIVVLADVRDPGNAGAVIRVADAAGAAAVVLAGESVDVDNPKVVRSTAGSLFHLPVATDLTVRDAVDAARSAGLTVLAADGGGEVDLFGASGVDLAQPIAWLFGNEARGLTDEQRAMADAVVRIPIVGKAESLNLATAAAVCLYARLSTA